MQQQRANPSASSGTTSTGNNVNNTSTTTTSTSNSTSNNAPSASARAYAEMHKAQERQVPTYSTDPNNHSGTSTTSNKASSLGPLSGKFTLDEYLRSMQQRGYPMPAYPTVGNSNPSNSAGALNPALLGMNHLGQPAPLNATREMYMNLPYMAGQNFYSDSVNASLAGTKANSNSPPQSTVDSGNSVITNSEAVPGNTKGDVHETDREGKEKGHSAAAEALLTLLKK